MNLPVRGATASYCERRRKRVGYAGHWHKG